MADHREVKYSEAERVMAHVKLYTLQIKYGMRILQATARTCISRSSCALLARARFEARRNAARVAAGDV
jgi:hypothetical protein